MIREMIKEVFRCQEAIDEAIDKQKEIHKLELEAYKSDLVERIEKLKSEYHDNWHPIVTDIISIITKEDETNQSHRHENAQSHRTWLQN